jgi:FemAB-related protein (PEP-CTERM system-associated)
VISVAEVRTYDEGIAWDRYVLNHAVASGYQLMGWRRVMERSFGHQTFYLMARDEKEQVRGVLPLVFVSSRLFGRFLVSMPFVNYGGVLTDTSEAQRALLETAVSHATNLGATHIELRHQRLLSLDWTSTQHKVSMRLDLPREPETLSTRFPSKLRSQIRRALKEQLTVRIEGTEILDDFYRVFSRNMRDLGTPVYGRRFFETILETFPKDARICVAYLGRQPVAAGFLYGFQNTLEIPWASSDRRYNHLSANMLVYSSALDYACREGFEVFDFGRSTPGGGTYRFKEQWGAHSVPLHWYHWSPDGCPVADVSPENSKYGLAIKTWKRLPLALTRLIGPSIVRSIP